MTAPTLAIDAGQTGMKVRIDTEDGPAELLFRGIDTSRALLPQLADVAAAAIAQTSATPTILAAGVSGLTDREADAEALLSLVAGTGIRSTILAHDSATSFLAAIGDRRGAVVASGTGVVTLAVGSRHVARVDGWGWIMGDAGSGYWIGREALDAAMRAYDGRGPATALTEVVQERWPDLSHAYIDLQGDEGRVSIVASFAEHVARLAAEGDDVSRRITRAAAAELAGSVAAALAQVRDDDEILSVCAIGGVFRSGLLHDDFAAALARLAPSTELVPPRGGGIDGVAALPTLGSRHPLGTQLWRAGAL